MIEIKPFKEWASDLARNIGAAAYGTAEGLLVIALGVFVAPPLYVMCALYVWALQGRSNCLVWALWTKARNRRRKVVCVRNSRGRRHWQVIGVDGSRWEWYAKGASQRSRLANLWYKGEAKKVSDQ